MRKLDLSSYNVTDKVIGGDGEVIEVTAPYNVKDSVINVLFMPAVGLQGAALIRQNMLAMKIEASKDGFVILEEEEYQRVKSAAELFKAPSRAHVEFIDRILNKAPEVD